MDYLIQKTCTVQPIYLHLEPILSHLHAVLPTPVPFLLFDSSWDSFYLDGGIGDDELCSASRIAIGDGVDA